MIMKITKKLILLILFKKIFKNIKIEIVEKDLDLRSYRLDFSKMKNYFNLDPGSNILDASKLIIENMNTGKYGDVNSKKYYNT